MDLNLKESVVIVIGGGKEALKKINSLLTQDCKVLVFADKINPTLKKYANQKKIIFKKKKLKDGKFLAKYKPDLVMAATDNKKLNSNIIKEGLKINSLVYASDDPEKSDFSNLSIITLHDAIQFAISTGSCSPAMTKIIKEKTEKLLKKIVKKDDIYHIKLQNLARKAAKEKISNQKHRKKFLYSLLKDSIIKQLIKDRKIKKAEKRAMTMLGDWS